MTGPNGAKFDKLARRDALRKADVDLSKLPPPLAKAIDNIDMKFAEILARLQKIEDTHDAIRLQPPRFATAAREPDGDEVLRSMRAMSPAEREALLNKLKQ